MVKKKPAGKAKPRKSRKKTTPKKRKPVKRAEAPVRTFEQAVEEFGEEMEKVGERFGKHMERKGKECETSWNRTFGAVGPFLSSICGLVVFAVVIWILGMINLPLSSVFLAGVYSFLLSNIALFFVFFLFFSYTSYFHKRYKRAYIPISPITISIGITICFWLLMSAMFLINIVFASTYLNVIAFSIQFNLVGIFIFFMFLGYLVLFIKAIFGKLELYEMHELPKHREEVRATREKPVSGKAGEIKRLYRSGRDKILGGVCGGIAEYLGLDPVIIRLIWVLLTLASLGTGIIAYIIAWIIIPRNPRDARHWKD